MRNMKRTYECRLCGARTEIKIDCQSFICPYCHWENKIQVEQWAPIGGGWLDEHGICHFPSTVRQIPNGIYIASGTHELELVLQIIYYPAEGPEPAYYKWDQSQSIPEEVLATMIGVVLDQPLIDRLQGDCKGRGILLGESDGDIKEKGLTPEEWVIKYGFNGMSALLRQRIVLFNKTRIL